MKIGLISDTHGFLDAKVFSYFKTCDEIWHAGDIGTMDVCNALETFKPFRGVFGNIDDKQVQSKYPEDLRFNCEGLNIWITHIGGAPPNYNARVRSGLQQLIPDIFICGHSHVLKVGRDAKYNNMLYVNPGAAGNHGFHKMKTLIRFEIKAKVISNMEVIELGKRGVIES
jgi:uncharacterized protein